MGALFESQSVTAASLCVYLLMGVLWAILYSLLQIVEPGSFAFSFADGESEMMRWGGNQGEIALYYSFVTMSTLGYGDIIPTSSLSRTCAALQAIVGQLYLAVLVARLVGLHIVRPSAKE